MMFLIITGDALRCSRSRGIFPTKSLGYRREDMIEISASAQTYLQELLAKQDGGDVGIRVFVAQPGTPHAETCIAYCQPGEEQEGDTPVAY